MFGLDGGMFIHYILQCRMKQESKMFFDMEKVIAQQEKMVESSFDMARKSLDVANAVMKGSLDIVETNLNASKAAFKSLVK